MAYLQADTGTVARRRQPDVDPVVPYLSRIRKFPLLTAQEEVQLGKAMEAGQRAERWLQKGVVALDCATRLEVERRKRAARQARDKFLISNLRLVVHLVLKLGHGSGMEPMDLIQAGNLGLMRAVEKWDWRRGFKFSTYATHWIRQFVTREIQNHSRTIRIPVHLWKNVNKYCKVYDKRYKMTGEPPTLEQMSGYMKLSLIEVIRLSSVVKDTLSWEEIVNEPPSFDNIPIFDDPDNPAIFQENGGFDEYWEDFGAAERLIAVEDNGSDVLPPKGIDWLPLREKQILILRFGLDGSKLRTLEEIGQEFKLTRERVRQLLQAALCKLRHPSSRIKP